jgi:transposase
MEEPTMAKVRSWVGLDVHARSVLAVMIDGESGELVSRRLSGTTSEVVEFCRALPGPARVAYEAGPTGYGLARALELAGVGCVVAAPGKIERPSADRVKTDQRDAERVLRLLMIDGLHAVRVPSSEEEALRDVVRAREAVRGDLMRARQRLGKLLLRHDLRYEDTASAWTIRHRAWLTRIDLGQRGAQITLLEYLGAIDAIVIRRDALEKAIAELIPGSPWAQTVARLRCLRGIDTLSAVGLCAEGRRLRTVRTRGAADELHRPGPLRGDHRREAPPRRDHQNRLAARPPAARRGGLALPPRARQGPVAPPPPGRAASRDHRDRVAGPTTTAPRVAATGHPARQAPHDRRGGRRPRARRVLLGTRQRRLRTPSHHVG